MPKKRTADHRSEIARAVELCQDLVALVDNRAVIIWVNDALAEKLGMKPTDVPGKHFNILFDPDLSDLAQEVLISAINDGYFHGELLMAGHDGSFPAHVRASFIPPEKEGSEFSILFRGSDQSAQKIIENEARKRREFLDTIIRKAPLGIFCLDSLGYFTVINDAIKDLSEKAGLDLKLNVSVFEYQDLFSDKTLEIIKRGLKGEELIHGDVPMMSHEHPRPIVNIMGSPIRSPGGKLEGLAVIIEDRTEKHRVDEKMKEADRLASLGILAAGVAHEVNNPLTGIFGVMGNLKKEALEKGIDVEYFDRVHANLIRISNIVKSLLDFSRKKVGVVKDVDINDLVEKTVSFFRMQPRFKYITLQLEITDDIPLITVDSVQIEQVLQNLIINAAQAIKDDGTITLRTDFDHVASEVIIRVQDTGVGIEKENLDKIFEPFFTTKEPGQGTGLGLAVSNSIIRQHGGSINVEESSPNGTTFAVRIPSVKNE